MIVKPENLTGFLTDVRKQKKSIVFTNGWFDIVHKGHIDYLNKAKALGDVLIIGLNSDKSVHGLKGKNRPIISEQERAFLLDNLKAVDAVILFDDETPSKLIETIKPDILAKGADYQVEQIAGAKFVIENGGKVKLLPFLEGYSSSSIIEKIRANYK